MKSDSAAASQPSSALMVLPREARVMPPPAFDEPDFKRAKVDAPTASQQIACWTPVVGFGVESPALIEQKNELMRLARLIEKLDMDEETMAAKVKTLEKLKVTVGLELKRLDTGIKHCQSFLGNKRMPNIKVELQQYREQNDLALTKMQTCDIDVKALKVSQKELRTANRQAEKDYKEVDIIIAKMKAKENSDLNAARAAAKAERGDDAVDAVDAVESTITSIFKQLDRDDIGEVTQKDFVVMVMREEDVAEFCSTPEHNLRKDFHTGNSGSMNGYVLNLCGLF